MASDVGGVGMGGLDRTGVDWGERVELWSGEGWARAWSENVVGVRRGRAAVSVRDVQAGKVQRGAVASNRHGRWSWSELSVRAGGGGNDPCAYRRGGAVPRFVLLVSVIPFRSLSSLVVSAPTSLLSLVTPTPPIAHRPSLITYRPSSIAIVHRPWPFAIRFRLPPSLSADHPRPRPASYRFTSVRLDFLRSASSPPLWFFPSVRTAWD